MEHFGRIDILVNNSGVYEFAPLESITEDHFHKLFNINVLGLLSDDAGGGQASWRRRQRHQHQLRRHKPHSRFSRPFTPARRAQSTPSQVCSLSNSLPKKIRVNAINPGFVETEGTHSGGIIGSDFERDGVAQTPLGRIGQPSDIASVAVFLASDDLGWLTGDRITASGGLR